MESQHNLISLHNWKNMYALDLQILTCTYAYLNSMFAQKISRIVHLDFSSCKSASASAFHQTYV